MGISITMQFTTTAITLALSASVGHAFAPSIVTRPPTSSSTVVLHAARQPIMAGNWKMNPPTEADALELGSALTKLLGEETCPISDDDEACTEVVVFPPHPFISKVKDTVDEVGVTVGAQSMFWEKKGAYTGEVAGSMLKSIGC